MCPRAPQLQMPTSVSRKIVLNLIPSCPNVLISSSEVRYPRSGSAQPFSHCPYDCEGPFADSGCNPANREACFDISARANENKGTLSTVPWIITEVWNSAGRVETPDISSVVQDIIDSGSWKENNALLLSFMDQQMI